MNQIASILAFIIGIMSIVAGGKAMRGWNLVIPSSRGFPYITS